MPHGVLFRGGEERDIRTGIIDDDLLEAVIGLPPEPVLRHRHPGLHPGAARARGAKPAERQGKVLFINADREYFEGRAQNYLLPEHIEKIVSTFERVRGHPGLRAPS